MARELGPVVDADQLRFPVLLDEALEHARDAGTRERVVDFDEEALPREGVDQFSVRNGRPLASESWVKSIVHCCRGRVGGGGSTRTDAAMRFRYIHPNSDVAAMKKRPSRGTEFEEFAGTPACQAANVELEEHRARARAEYALAAVPLLAALRQRAIHVDAVGELLADPEWVRGRGRCHEIAAILLQWVPRLESLRVREDVVRTLSLRWCREAVPVLLDEFRRAPTDLYRFAVGNALEVLATDALFEDLVALASEPAYGSGRQMVVRALARMKKRRSDAIDVLVSLLDDPGEGAAIPALDTLRRMKARVSRDRLRRFLASPRRDVRRWADEVLARSS